MMLPKSVLSFSPLSSVSHRARFASLLLHREQRQISSSTALSSAQPQSFSTTSTLSPNNLLPLTTLTHTYYALRHGQSLANVQKIISSDPKISTFQHGLSEIGKKQAAKAGIELTQSIYDPTKYCGIAIVSSDFTRAKETAQIVASAIQQESSSSPQYAIPFYKDNVQFDVTLRERYFGLWNGKADKHYHDVWKLDAISADHTDNQVESVNSVLHRTTNLILSLEDDLSGVKSTNGDSNENGDVVCEKPWLCVLVAHGDVLQFLQTGFKKMDGTNHRTLEHLETATLRQLLLE